MTVKTTPETRQAGGRTGELARLDAWWRAANYLSAGQIYLLDNPLLHGARCPLAILSPG